MRTNNQNVYKVSGNIWYCVMTILIGIGIVS